MRFPAKIISSCIWVAVPVIKNELFYIGMPKARTDGRRSAVGVRSRDYQISGMGRFAYP